MQFTRIFVDFLDDSIRSAIAHTIQAIGIHNQDVIKTYSTTVLPLVFFATHVDKNPENQNTLNIWQEIWSEHSPGTFSTILTVKLTLLISQELKVGFVTTLNQFAIC